MKETTVRVGKDLNEKLRELKISLSARDHKITQKELVEKMILFSLKHKMDFLKELEKKEKKDSLYGFLEKPVKKGPKTNCVKEIDLTVSSG
jgi:hypothetical protein